MPVVLILPLTKEQLASQECVGEMTNGALKSALRTSTFKTSGKQEYLFPIPVGNGFPFPVGNKYSFPIPVGNGFPFPVGNELPFP